MNKTKKIPFIFCLTALLAFGFFIQKSKSQEVGAKWVVPPVVDADKFELSPREDDSRFVVSKKEFSGVCDKSGKIILPIEYSNIRLYTCGWIYAYKKDKYHLFNARGENIGLPYDKYVIHNNGTAIVYKNNLCGLINMEGEELVPLEYEQFKKNGNVFLFKKGDAERLFDAPAETVMPAVKRMAETKARAVLTGYHYLNFGPNACGFLSLKGDTLVPPIYRFGSMHPAGYLVASLDGGVYWGVIDTRHKTLYPFTAQKIGTWTDSGLLPIRSEKQWALMRFPKGEVVFPFGQYEHVQVYDPHKDLFLVVKDKLQGIVDAKGKVILPCAYTYISQYDHITTEIAGPDGKRGFWHRPTGYLQAPIYKGIKNLADSLVIVYDDSIRHALLDAKTGRVIIPFSDFWIDRLGNYFDSHKKYDPKVVATYKAQLHGLYNRKGKLILPHDSVDVYAVLADKSFWVCPHYKDSAPNYEQRTPDGKVLRSMPKIGGDLKQFGFLITFVRNSNGQQTAKQYYYLDAEGKEQYYQSIDNLQENLRRVKRNNLWGCIDDDNKVIIQPVFEELENSVDGYIRVKYQGKWGVLQNPKFDYFKDFKEEK